MRQAHSKQPKRARGRPPKLLAVNGGGRDRRSADPPAKSARGIGHNRPPLDPLEGKLCIRPTEVGPILGIGPSLVWELIKDGRLKSAKVGKARLIFTKSIRELLANSAT